VAVAQGSSHDNLKNTGHDNPKNICRTHP